MNSTNSKSSTYDSENTMYNIGVYFNNTLIDYATGRPLMTRKNGQLVPKKYMKYHLKFLDEKDYQGKNTEMMGMIRILRGIIMNNSLKRVTLYQNINKGGKLLLEKGENPEIMVMTFRDNKVESLNFNPKLPDEFKSYFLAVVEKLKAEL